VGSLKADHLFLIQKVVTTESKGSQTSLHVTCQTIRGPKCRAMGPHRRRGIFTRVASTTIRCVSDVVQEKWLEIDRVMHEPKYCHL
jgi:hypothetical protein